MALRKLWVIGYRDLLRNRRRSLFTLLAVALGLALLIVLNGFITGVFTDAIDNNIRLQTGHVQLRAPSYSDEKMSLLWADLLDNPEELVQRAQAQPGVVTAAPVLWATGIAATADDSASLHIYGIDPTSAFYAPFQSGLIAGAYLTPDDRSGILIGQRLANNLRLSVDDNVSLTAINADGVPEEGIFTVRGIFNTGIVTYDENALFMSLAKAQAFTRTDDHVSAIVLLLTDKEQADSVAAALATPGIASLTWRDLNRVMLESVETGMGFYLIFDAIVMLIVAVIIANTLLMAVFERIREMGILAALGMKGRQIMTMFVLEAAILGFGGVILGALIGLGVVGYLSINGIFIGEMAGSTPGIALGTTMYAAYAPQLFANLALWTLIIILLASLYPGWFAARREPAEALHTL
ncbi:MAG TPA: ABC transporter permease [Caldilineaceae bacterium]|nr:ABC transporter permease [Caldilineaceae bacterium]